MAKGIYVGVDDTARKVRRAYIGVDDIARRIKKAYIGVGGVARPCYTTELEYWGVADSSLSVARYNMGTATVGNYVLIAGGTTVDGNSNVVDACRKDLTITVAPSLSYARVPKATSIKTTSNGICGIFGGGYTENNRSYYVDAISEDLVKLSGIANFATQLYDELHYCHNTAAATVNNTAIFFRSDTSEGVEDYIYSYDETLTQKTATHKLGYFSLYSGYVAGTVGNYALFGGGSDINKYAITTMGAFDSSLTQVTVEAMSARKAYIEAASFGGYALFGPGYNNKSSYSDQRPKNTIDAYDESLTHSVIESAFANFRMNYTAAANSDYAVFVGGENSGGYFYGSVNVFDRTLTRLEVKTHSALARRYMSSAEINDKILVFGGLTDDSDDEDYYSSDIHVFV